MIKNNFANETAIIDEVSETGKGTKIWHFSSLILNCNIGENEAMKNNIKGVFRF